MLLLGFLKLLSLSLLGSLLLLDGIILLLLELDHLGEDTLELHLEVDLGHGLNTFSLVFHLN